MKVKDIELLNTRHIVNYKPEESKFFINLTSTNSKADEINKEYLSKLKGKRLINLQLRY